MNLYHRVGEGLGLLLRQVMSRIDDAVLVLRHEHARVLCGAAGFQRDLDRLVAARLLKQELNAPVICELTGEDIFLGAMSEPHKSQARQIIRDRARDVDRFVATSRYYATEMSRYLDVPEDQIEVVYPGLPEDYIQSAIGNRESAIESQDNSDSPLLTPNSELRTL